MTDPSEPSYEELRALAIDAQGGYAAASASADAFREGLCRAFGLIGADGKWNNPGDSELLRMVEHVIGGERNFWKRETFKLLYSQGTAERPGVPLESLRPQIDLETLRPKGAPLSGRMSVSSPPPTVGAYWCPVCQSRYPQSTACPTHGKLT